MDEQLVAFDVGSGSLRAGLNTDNPTICFDAVSGAPKSYMKNCMPLDAPRKDRYVGPEAQQFRGLLGLEWPIKHGRVEHWGRWEELHEYALARLKLGYNNLYLMHTEPVLNPISHYENLMQISFEKFGADFCYLSWQSQASLMSSGRLTGAVVTVGAGVTEVVPYFWNCIIKEGIRRWDFGGQDIDEQLKRLMLDRGVTLSSPACIPDIKHALCEVPLDFEAQQRECETISTHEKNYTLPDGEIITLNHERFSCMRYLFEPWLPPLEIEKETHPGLPGLIMDSILSCPMDFRNSLWNETILAGATTLCPGLPNYLSKVLRERISNYRNPGNTRWKELADPTRAARYPSLVQRLPIELVEEVGRRIQGMEDPVKEVVAAPERGISAWIGAIFLSTSRWPWLTKEEYEESGTSLRKGATRFLIDNNKT